MVRMSEARETENWSATPAKRELAPAPRRVVRWKDAERASRAPPAAGGGGLVAPGSSGPLGAKSVATSARLDFCMSTATFCESGSLFLIRNPSMPYSTSRAKCFTTKAVGASRRIT